MDERALTESAAAPPGHSRSRRWFAVAWLAGMFVVAYVVSTLTNNALGAAQPSGTPGVVWLVPMCAVQFVGAMLTCSLSRRLLGAPRSVWVSFALVLAVAAVGSAYVYLTFYLSFTGPQDAEQRFTWSELLGEVHPSTFFLWVAATRVLPATAGFAGAIVGSRMYRDEAGGGVEPALQPDAFKVESL